MFYQSNRRCRLLSVQSLFLMVKPLIFIVSAVQCPSVESNGQDRSRKRQPTWRKNDCYLSHKWYNNYPNYNTIQSSFLYKNSVFQAQAEVFLFFGRVEAEIFSWLILDYREKYFGLKMQKLIRNKCITS